MWLFDKRKLHNIEYILLIIVAVISLFGLLAILMATADASTGGEEATLFEMLSRLNLSSVVKQACGSSLDSSLWPVLLCWIITFIPVSGMW